MYVQSGKGINTQMSLLSYSSFFSYISLFEDGQELTSELHAESDVAPAELYKLTESEEHITTNSALILKMRCYESLL